MLVAPLPIPASESRAVPPRRPASIAGARPRDAFARAVVLGWLALGGFALALAPSSPADANLGATPVFWLVGAPLINLAWLERHRVARALGRMLAGLRPRRRRGARHLAAIRPARRCA